MNIRQHHDGLVWAVANAVSRPADGEEAPPEEVKAALKEALREVITEENLRQTKLVFHLDGGVLHVVCRTWKISEQHELNVRFIHPDKMPREEKRNLSWHSILAMEGWFTGHLSKITGKGQDPWRTTSRELTKTL